MVDRVLPTIDLVRCTGCGLCAEYCPGRAVDIIDGRPAIVRPQTCSYCGICEDMCPVGAVALVYEFVLSDPERSQQGESNDTTDRAD